MPVPLGGRLLARRLEASFFSNDRMQVNLSVDVRNFPNWSHDVASNFCQSFQASPLFQTLQIICIMCLQIKWLPIGVPWHGLYYIPRSIINPSAHNLFYCWS